MFLMINRYLSSAAIFFFATSLLLIRMMQAVFLPSIFL